MGTSLRALQTRPVSQRVGRKLENSDIFIRPEGNSITLEFDMRGCQGYKNFDKNVVTQKDIHILLPTRLCADPAS